MTFIDGLLPIAQFRDTENEYLDLLKQSPALASTAETATLLMSTFNNLWDFFRRGRFYSDNEELEELSTNTVRFFLIPYYIGRLHLLYQGQARPSHLEVATAILTSFWNDEARPSHLEEMTRLGVIGEDKPRKEVTRRSNSGREPSFHAR
jgi:hypothetical protein